MTTRCRICGRDGEHDHKLVTELDPVMFRSYDDFEREQELQVKLVGGRMVRKEWARRNERPADVHLPPTLIEHWTAGGMWQIYKEVNDE